MEAAEKEKTGIRTLKIGYNKVFGYYIEVSNSFKDQVPADYISKQTLVNGERYITQELKNLESDILTASDRVSALEYELFTDLRTELAGQVSRIQASASAVAELDSLCSLASVAVSNGYCRPTVDESGVLEIHDGRHPVVEKMRPDALFVPNDTYMGGKRGPGRHHHRPQYGRVSPPICARWPDGAHGPDRLLRPGQGRKSGRGGPHFHPHRRQRRSRRRTVHLHGGDDRGERYASLCHQKQPAHSG